MVSREAVKNVDKASPGPLSCHSNFTKIVCIRVILIDLTNFRFLFFFWVNKWVQGEGRVPNLPVIENDIKFQLKFRTV